MVFEILERIAKTAAESFSQLLKGVKEEKQDAVKTQQQTPPQQEMPSTHETYTTYTINQPYLHPKQVEAIKSQLGENVEFRQGSDGKSVEVVVKGSAPKEIAIPTYEQAVKQENIEKSRELYQQASPVEKALWHLRTIVSGKAYEYLASAIVPGGKSPQDVVIEKMGETKESLEKEGATKTIVKQTVVDTLNAPPTQAALFYLGGGVVGKIASKGLEMAPTATKIALAAAGGAGAGALAGKYYLISKQMDASNIEDTSRKAEIYLSEVLKDALAIIAFSKGMSDALKASRPYDKVVEIEKSKVVNAEVDASKKAMQVNINQNVESNKNAFTQIQRIDVEKPSGYQTIQTYFKETEASKQLAYLQESKDAFATIQTSRTRIFLKENQPVGFDKEIEIAKMPYRDALMRLAELEAKAKLVTRSGGTAYSNIIGQLKTKTFDAFTEKSFLLEEGGRKISGILAEMSTRKIFYDPPLSQTSSATKIKPEKVSEFLPVVSQIGKETIIITPRIISTPNPFIPFPTLSGKITGDVETKILGKEKIDVSKKMEEPTITKTNTGIEEITKTIRGTERIRPTVEKVETPTINIPKEKTTIKGIEKTKHEPIPITTSTPPPLPPYLPRFIAGSIFGISSMHFKKIPKMKVKKTSPVPFPSMPMTEKIFRKYGKVIIPAGIKIKLEYGDYLKKTGGYFKEFRFDKYLKKIKIKI